MKYEEQERKIYAKYDDKTIRVYQAYNDKIADEAIKLGTFGEHFSLTRMPWIKPSFLWMMYRCGWAEKENQERVLAIDIKREAFDEIVKKFIQAMASSGLFAIELFLDKNGKVWVNETAPRLHNSGHLTQEGNSNSQFEQMYRVVKNLPLADTDADKYSGMFNLVGEEGYQGKAYYEGLEEVLKLPKTYVHLYGKTETKSGRKMGHINILADNREELLEKLTAIKSMIRVISKKH